MAKKKGKGLLAVIVCVCIAVPLYRCSHKSKELRKQLPSVSTELQTVTTPAQTTAAAPEPTTTTTTTAETTKAPETTSEKKKTKPKTTKAPETTAKASEPTQQEIQSAVRNGDFSLVTPEFKATMDAYESFYDDYITFMKKYNSAGADVLAMMNDYMAMLAKMEEWSDKIDAIDADKLSTADNAYYFLVTMRIEKKLIGAM